MKAHPSLWSLERNERAPAQAPSHDMATRRCRRPNRSGRRCRRYLCSTARCWLRRLHRSGHRRRLREGRSVSVRCRRSRPHPHRRHSMGRLTHHRHQRRQRRPRPGKRQCRWDNRNLPPRRCRRFRRACSTHRRCTSCLGSRDCLGFRKSRKWTRPCFRCRPYRRLCSSGFPQPRSKARQLRHRRHSYRKHRPLRTQHVRPCRWYHSRDHPRHRRFLHPTRKRPARRRHRLLNWGKHRQRRCTDCRHRRRKVRSSLHFRKANPRSRPGPRLRKCRVARPRLRRSDHPRPGRQWRHDSLVHRSHRRPHP